MTGFFDVNLKQIAHVVKRWSGGTEVALLLDGGGLGVTLRDDDATKLFAIFAWDLLPGSFIGSITETDFTILRRREKNSPAIFRHPDVGVICPTIGGGADSGTKVDLTGVKAVRTDLVPPLEKLRMPSGEGAAQLLVVIKINVVWNLAHVRLQSNCGLSGCP